MDCPAIASALTQHPLWRWVKRLYTATILILLGLAVKQAWPSLQQWNLAALTPGLAAATAGWLTMVIVLGYGWAGCLKALSGTALSVSQWLSMQASAWIGRYLPGKVGMLTGKLKACEYGTSWQQVTGSVFCEQLAFVTTGIAVSALATHQLMLLLPANLRVAEAAVTAALILPACIMVAWPWLPRGLGLSKRSWRVRLALSSTLAHLCAGLGFHGLLVAVMPQYPSAWASIGILAAAHVAGALAIFAPAGLGVREAVITAALSPYVGWPQAIAIAALQRSLTVVADGLVAAFSIALQWKMRH